MAARPRERLRLDWPATTICDASLHNNVCELPRLSARPNEMNDVNLDHECAANVLARSHRDRLQRQR